MRWYVSLRRTGEIAYVRRAGRRVGRSTLAAYGLVSDPPSRVCITVSKEVGSAVVRNLVRRRIRGALDALAPGAGNAGSALRVVFVARPASASESYERLAHDVRSALALLREAPGAQAHRPGRPRPVGKNRA